MTWSGLANAGSDHPVAEELRPTENGVERGAELVRDGREKYVLRAAGFFRHLRRTLCGRVELRVLDGVTATGFIRKPNE